MSRTMKLHPFIRWLSIAGVAGALLVVGLHARNVATGRVASFDTLGNTLGVGAYLALALWMHWVRYRIDETGVAQRWFFRWDSWPWERFASGELVRRARTFTDPARPWYWRRFPVMFPRTEEHLALEKACLDHWKPPAFTMPPSLSLRAHTGLISRTEVTLTEEGITLEKEGVVARLAWRGDATAWVVKQTPWDVAFTTLRIVGGEGQLDLSERYGKYGRSRSWKGAEGEWILAYIEQHLPPERLHLGVLRYGGEKPDQQAFDVLRARQGLREERDGWRGMAVAAAAYGLVILGMLDLTNDLSASAFLTWACSVVVFLGIGLLVYGHKVRRWRRVADQMLASFQRSFPDAGHEKLLDQDGFIVPDRSAHGLPGD